MVAYPIRFTDLARAFLGDSVSAFEEQARGELAESKKPTKIVIHCIRYNDRWFGCVGAGDHVIVDTVTFKEMPAMTEGLFKGKKPMIPICDTEGGIIET